MKVHDAKLALDNATLLDKVAMLQARAEASEAEVARLLERMFELCRQGRVAAGCVDTSHGVGWNACITWMESALCAVGAERARLDQPQAVLTPQMVENMARAIGNTMRWPNHRERARAVWNAAFDTNPQPLPAAPKDGE